MCLRQHVTFLGGSGLDYVILLSEGGGWVLIAVDYGGLSLNRSPSKIRAAIYCVPRTYNTQ